jgi:hypothetical protein
MTGRRSIFSPLFRRHAQPGRGGPAGRQPGSPWRRVVGALAACLVLLPVPAMALTFTGSWVASYSQSGGPTPPTPTFTDNLSADQNQDVLTVNMGTYQGATAPATSTIQLARPFSVSARSQTVEFDHAFTTLFNQGGATVTVAVQDALGQTLVTPINFSQSTTGTAFLSDDETVFNRLRAGNYTLAVTVTYQTSNKIGGYQSRSVHTFDFEGIPTY